MSSSIFKTKITPYCFGKINLQITSVENFDELYDQLLQKGLTHEEVADERIPYWAEVWISAVALATFLEENKEFVSGKNVLEVGAGLGLPSILASKLGAQLTCTDYLQDALNFAEKNAIQNNCTSISFQKLDWRETELDEKYDIILASDVAYERSQFEFLESFLNKNLKSNNVFYLSEPNRYIAKEWLQSLTNKGFKITTQFYSYENPKATVSVYTIRKDKKLE